MEGALGVGTVPAESRGLAAWPGGRVGTLGGQEAACRALSTGDALQDVRLLAAGKAPQRAAEVERDLDKADGMIRLLFNDVQTLKDGRHPQGEQMYRRWAVPRAGWGRPRRSGDRLISPRPSPPPGCTACTSAWWPSGLSTTSG